MKKTLISILILAMISCFAACSAEAPEKSASSSAESAASLSQPSGSAGVIDPSDWSGQDYIDYFTEAGLFTDREGYETWIQSHEDYWPGTPVRECAGWWDLAGDEVCVLIVLLDPELEDISEEEYEEWMTEIREERELPGSYAMLGTVDHLAGNTAFCYTDTTLDEESLEKVEEAFAGFFRDAGITPEF